MILLIVCALGGLIVALSCKEVDARIWGER